MSNKSNFSLMATQHDCAMSIIAPGDLAEDATSTLAHHAKKISVVLAGSGDSVITWDAGYTAESVLKAVYFERIDLSDCSLELHTGVPGTLSQIAFGQQVDDFLFAEALTGHRNTDYRILLNVPDQSAASIALTPPFLGGEDLADIGGMCYSYGYDYQYLGDVEFQQSKTRQLPVVSPTYPAKSYSIEHVNRSDADYAFDFIRAQQGKLVLFREYSPTSKHHTVLGWVVAESVPVSSGGLHTFNITITAKNAR